MNVGEVDPFVTVANSGDEGKKGGWRVGEEGLLRWVWAVLYRERFVMYARRGGIDKR